MNKSQREELFAYETRGLNLGFTRQELETARRAAMILHRWFEHECNGVIQRDEETRKCHWYSSYDGRRLGPASDRETPANKRVREIAKRVGFLLEIQGDPRGWPVHFTDLEGRRILSVPVFH